LETQVWPLNTVEILCPEVNVRLSHIIQTTSIQGRREKQNDGSDVHLPQPQNKVITFVIVFLIALFGRFVTRGVQKHDNCFSKKSIWAHYKKCGYFFSLSRFLFSLGRFARFVLSRFWAFRNKGSSKR
jgi:hypothetical protein